MNYAETPTQWYVLKIKTGWDEKISDMLSKLGYEAFVPMVNVPNNETNLKKKSLFPGYSFVYMSKNDKRWSDITNINGVLGWVTFDDEIPSLTELSIKKIKKTIFDLDQTGGLWDRYVAGDLVKIQNSTMDSFGEVLEDVKSPDSFVQVIMQFMGRMVKASVHVSRLSISNPSVNNINKNRARRSRGNGRIIKNHI
ncbi:MAG: transcription termination/antitermination protein NusG [Dehalococcoidia bacterium]